MDGRKFSSVTKELNRFVRNFDEEYACKIGKDFEAVDDTYIVYAIAINDDSDMQSFREDFIHRFPCCDEFDTFTLSFMHELGHLETSFDAIDDIKQRERIARMKNHTLALTKYYALHNERIATDWAGEYLTGHYDEMRQWETKILSLINRVLKSIID